MREKLLKFKMIVAIVFASTTLFAQNEKDSTNIYDLSLEQLMNIEVTTASKKTKDFGCPSYSYFYFSRTNREIWLVRFKRYF